MSPDEGPPTWRRDRWVHAGAAAAAISSGAVFFAGQYLPYIDWAAHVGKIGVLAHGGESGAIAYFTRSWVPTPYLLFYAFTALLAQVTTVETAAKLAIVITGPLLTYGAAELAESCGRHPRLGLVAPLAIFGMSLGWGFSPWLFSLPWLLFAFAATERLIEAPGDRRKIGWLAVTLGLAYLGHALLFAILVPLIAVRLVGRARPLLSFAVALVPSVLLALPALLSVLARPAGHPRPTLDKMFTFRPLREHVAELGGDLLQRGPADHAMTMRLVVGLFVAQLLLSSYRSLPRRSSWGLEIYTLGLLALFFFGPMSIEWPFSAWLVYPRYGTLAFLLVALLPRADLSGKIGAALSVIAIGLLAQNASLNIGHVSRFGEYADRYTPVRALIPKGARVLALTVTPPGDFSHAHHALGSLYCYLLADGAAYTAFMMDDPLHPVRYRKDVTQPRAPFWRSPDAYDPRTHGVDYDYLVLRGEGIVQRTVSAGNHELVADVQGWRVFRTKAPPPAPSP